MNNIIKKNAMFILIISALCLTSCSDDVIDDKKAYSINSNAYEKFIKNHDNMKIEPIPVKLDKGFVFYDNKPIYKNINEATKDAFIFINILNESFLIKKEVNIDKYIVNPSSYSGNTLTAIHSVNGMLWDEKDKIDKSYFDILNDAGLYSVSAIDDKYIRVFDANGVRKYCEEQASNTWVNVVGITSIDNKLIIDINTELMNEVISLDSSSIKISVEDFNNNDNVDILQDENIEESEENAEDTNSDKNDIEKKDQVLINASKEKYYKYFIKRDNKKHYANYFSDSDYVVKDGFVVPSEEQVAYIEKLSSQDLYDYARIEAEVFKLNNLNAKIVKNEYNCPMQIYKKGDFLQNGMPAWVNRNLNTKTTDIFGRDLYADCSPTIDGYQMFCGGTNTAFHGWKLSENKDVDKNYNDVIQNGAKWNDKYFVDVEVEYHGVANNTENYAKNLDIAG